MADQYIQNHR